MDFAVGRAVFSPQHSLSAEARATGEVAVLAAGRLQLIARLERLVPRVRWAPRPSDSLAADLVQCYAATAQIVEALSAAYGFRVLYVWQPSIQTTAKPLSPFERDIVSTAKADRFWLRRGALHGKVPGALAEAMAQIAPGRFIDLSALFAGDTSTMYLDEIGHTTEHAVGTIVDAMLPKIERLLHHR
jgi:hypothetical protein